MPWRRILLLGVAMVLFYMVDTAATTWGPTYLDNTFPTPERWVAMATFPYLLATLVMRFAGDSLVARFGPVRVLRAGGVLASLSLLVVAKLVTVAVPYGFKFATDALAGRHDAAVDRLPAFAAGAVG